MKNLITFMMLLSATLTFAQEKKGIQMVKILTSAVCEDCEARLEDKLNYTKGIKYASLDLETKMLEVKFSNKKISLETIKKIISDLGYSADEVKANPTAYSALPKCCQEAGHCLEK